jgi:NADPH:quinone reductase-like Zn-dependent oxidoreductase
LTVQAQTNRALVYREFGSPIAVMKLEHQNLQSLEAQVRVQMLLAPINPSDLIPVTGAYAHRVRPPRVAGYEGVGRVVGVRDDSLSHLLGRRVLPLREGGTWQKYLDCEGQWLVEVPDGVTDDKAARAYINPLTALFMAERWPPAGKRVLLTAAASSCGSLLAHICRMAGAHRVSGTYRSPSSRERLLQTGVIPLQERGEQIVAAASECDLVFDCVGGALLQRLSQAAPVATFVSYGNLSGERPAGLARGIRLEQFRLVDAIQTATPEDWQRRFVDVWRLLANAELPPLKAYKVENWKQALDEFGRAGRGAKPAFAFR